MIKGNVVLKALCYKSKSRGFDTWLGEWFLSVYQIIPSTLDPVVIQPLAEMSIRYRKMFLDSNATAGA
jgi:hypothetical protein